MAIELGLRALLIWNGTLTNLAPAQVINGVSYPAVFNEHPVQGFRPPFVLISAISHDPMKHLGGTSGLAMTEIDIDCYAYSYPLAQQMSKVASDLLRDYVGLAGTEDYIEAVLWDNERYDSVFEAQGRDVRHHIKSITLTIQHRPVT